MQQDPIRENSIGYLIHEVARMMRRPLRFLGAAGADAASAAGAGFSPSGISMISASPVFSLRADITQIPFVGQSSN